MAEATAALDAATRRRVIDSRVIDLSRPLDAQTPVHPTHPPYRVALVRPWEMEQRHRRRRLGPPARLEAMARQQVFDVEGAEAQLHTL